MSPAGGAHIIDGKAIAAAARAAVAAGVASLRQEAGVAPGLAVILVGEDPASRIYVANKAKQTVACGMQSFEYRLPATVGEDELLALVRRLNGDDRVHGILVQLPLPKQVRAAAVIETIDPDKDVDGFHVVNAGRLMTGGQGIVPCTPLGCMELIRASCDSLTGLEAVVLGRSNIVGKPLAALLLGADCTTTVAHSRTRDLPSVCRRADILVVAVGRPEFVRGSWIKPGAIVIDVGINRIPADNGRTRLVGDVAFAEAATVAGAITPVPGGVGPMTIAMLLRNTLEAARRVSAAGTPREAR